MELTFCDGVLEWMRVANFDNNTRVVNPRAIIGAIRQPDIRATDVLLASVWAALWAALVRALSLNSLHPWLVRGLAGSGVDSSLPGLAL